MGRGNYFFNSIWFENVKRMREMETLSWVNNAVIIDAGRMYRNSGCNVSLKLFDRDRERERENKRGRRIVKSGNGEAIS